MKSDRAEHGNSKADQYHRRNCRPSQPFSKIFFAFFSIPYTYMEGRLPPCPARRACRALLGMLLRARQGVPGPPRHFCGHGKIKKYCHVYYTHNCPVRVKKKESLFPKQTLPSYRHTCIFKRILNLFVIPYVLVFPTIPPPPIALFSATPRRRPVSPRKAAQAPCRNK